MDTFHTAKRRFQLGTPVVRAIGVSAFLTCLVLLGAMGQIANTPAALVSPLLGSIGPGKLTAFKHADISANGVETSRLELMARQALTQVPLAAEPFLASSAGKLRDGNDLTAQDAKRLNEALKRDPRSREARVMLLRYYLARNDLQGAVGKIAELNNLGSEAAVAMLVGLGKQVNNINQIDEVMSSLARYPQLYAPFISGYSERPRPANLTIRLASSIPAPALSDPSLRAAAISALLKSNAILEARQLWARTTRAKYDGLIFDPSFQDAVSSPPFNWTLATNEIGAADRNAGGGVHVRFNGRVPGTILSQIIALPAGSYLATVNYTRPDGDADAVSLRISCMPSGVIAGTAPLVPAKERADLVQRFDVPADSCTGQYLSIEGRPADGRATQDLDIHSINVRKAS